MINDKICKALNEQITLELSSAYIYLAMGAALEDQNLPGFARWMKAQYHEEVAHGMRLFDYVADRGGRVELGAIEKPPVDFGSPEKVFTTILEHERKVTASIHKLYELAVAEKDYATQTQLHWFINEQVEEEKTAEEILQQLKALGERTHMLLVMDHKLGARES